MQIGAGGEREIFAWAMGVAMLMLFCVCIPYGATFVLVVAGLAAPLGVGYSMAALGALALVRMSNPALLGTMMGPISIVGWMVFVIACLRILSSAVLSRGWASPPVVGLIVFAIVTVLLSYAASDYLAVSLSKIASFTLGAAAVLLGFRHLAERGARLFQVMLSVWIGTLAVSLPLLAIPAIGYFRDGLGFQGITNHPQVLAVFCAPILAWSVIGVLTQGARASFTTWLLLALSLVEVYFTRGRTAIAASGLAAILAIGIAFLGRGAWRKEIAGTRMMMRSFAVMSVLGALGMIYAAQVSEFMLEFIFKGDAQASSLGDSFESSRGLLIAEEIGNFLEQPLTGIGFGVGRSVIHPFEPVVEPVTGIVIGAPTEKSNIVVGLLEEVGIVGVLAFVPFLVVLLRQVARTAPLAVGCAALAALFVNISEMVFFSMGALGLYIFLVLGAAAYFPQVSPRACQRVSPRKWQ